MYRYGIYIHEDWYDLPPEGFGTVDTFISGVHSQFSIEKWQIVLESNNSDCGDDNDIARWLVRTLLAIRKKESELGNDFHSDFSAENKWEFEPVIRSK